VSSTAYFVRVGGEVRGPYALAELAELAGRTVITPETEAAPSSDGPWSLMITLPERAAIFPARVALAAKANFTATSDSPTAVHLTDVIASSATPGPLLRSRQDLEAEVYRAGPAATPPNEVEEMVRGVQAREVEFAPPLPPPPKRKMSRRLMLILALAVLGNAVLAAIPIAYGALGDEWSMLIFRGWFLIYNGGLVITYFALPKE
jgi:hypothetical protein